MNDFWRKAGFIGLGATLGILLTVNYSAIAVREPTLPVPVEDLKLFSEVYSRIKSEYVETVPDKKLIREAINGMVQGLDPHSAFLDEDGMKEMRTATEGKFGGVGIEIGVEDGFIKVISPIDDTPAQRAGIRSGDLIVRVDDETTKNLATDKAVKKMRGVPGTKVKLEVFRKGDNSSLTFNLVREEIKIWSVRSKMLDNGMGYVRVRSFQGATVSDFNKAVKDLSKAAPLKSLVLDLRDDPGGVLDAAVGLSAAFLPKDALVVYTDGRAGDSKMRLNATREHYARRGEDTLAGLPAELKSIPVVVLVNGGSASASEIVAGALKDHKRATLIGTTTFGKGSVQSILGLSSNAALKLTTSRYFTPNGVSIQAKGIDPDIVIEQLTFDGEDGPKRLREVDIARHLENKTQPEAPKAAGKAKDESDDETVKVNNARRFENFEFGNPAKDYQLAQAINHLAGKPVVVSTKPQKTAAATSTK